MTSVWAPTLAMALRLLGSPANVDFAVGAHAEVSGGSIPISIEDTLTPAAEAFFELHVGMRLRAPTDTLLVRYAPRLFGRLPGTEQLGRPLALHRLSFSYLARPTPRWTLNLLGTGSVGEIAYSGLQRAFTAGTGVLPASTVSLMTGNIEAGSSYQHTLRNTLRLAVRGGAQGPSVFDSTPQGALPAFTTVGADVRDDYRLNRMDTVSAIGTGTLFSSPDSGEIFLVGAEGAFARRLDSSSLLRVRAGATAAQSPTEGRPSVFPTSSLTYSTSWGELVRPWTATVTGGVQGFFDALSFDYRPVAFLTTGTTAEVLPSFHTGAQLSAFTSLTSLPAAAAPFETILGASLPSAYVLSRHVDLLFGARAFVFGPHLTELSSARAQAQFVLFIGVLQHDGTGPSRGDWLD